MPGPTSRIVANLFALLALTIAGPCFCAIAIDLSYVDQQSPAYQRFKAWVDQAVAGNPGYDFSATDAAYMYRLTGQLPYAVLAAAHVEAQVQQAEAAIALGNRPPVAGDSYLQVGPMLRDLALTLDWCATVVTPAQRVRWSAYAEQAIWNVWNHQDAQWGGQPFPWSGWSVDDPANNYYYSFVEATLHWALATGSATWMQLLEDTKLPELEQYMATIDGGGSQEGTAYGLSHRRLFSLYRVWRDSTGTNLANANDHLTRSIAWWIHATVPTLDRTAAIGDQARVSEPVLYDYHRSLMLEAHSLTSDASARDDASWWLNAIANQAMEGGFNYRHNLLPADSGGTPPADLVYHASGTGQLFARTGWDPGAMWLQFSAGPYVQSHAHQDQGAFTLYQHHWLAVTENIWTHSGIQQGTEVHNLVRFVNDGETVRQREGTVSTVAVTPGADGAVHAVADLTPAYDNHPAVQHWQRTLDFADRVLLVSDSFALGAGTEAIFQVNVPVQPVISGSTAVAGALEVRVIAPANATLQPFDWTTLNVPGDSPEYRTGWRIDVSGGTTGYVVELGIRNAIFGDGFE